MYQPLYIFFGKWNVYEFVLSTNKCFYIIKKMWGNVNLVNKKTEK